MTAALSFSHIGFFVTDIDAVAAFYKGALGFTQTDAGALGAVRLVFLSRDPAEHHQLVLVSGRPAGLAFNPINQISFRVPDLATLRLYHERLVGAGARDVQPVTHGNAISVYCRDTEDNRIEVFLDTPWYCEQPMRVPLDLAAPDADVMNEAREIACRASHFMPREQWQARIAARMAADQRAFAESIPHPARNLT